MDLKTNPSNTKDTTIKINEIFFSIQGESSFVGYPTVFVRTTGCNLRCTYCDTKYSYFEGEDLTLSKVLDVVRSHPARHVCITGGEPLLQKSTLQLMKELCDLGYIVSLETSGSRDWTVVDPRVRIVLDIKTPGSGEAKSFLTELLLQGGARQPLIELKFVICSEADFEWAMNHCRQYSLFEKYDVLFSPSFDEVSPRWLAEKLLASKSQARLQLQLHKYIWSPEARGV